MTAPQLSPGYVIAGKYSVQALLGHGGSSATYHVVDSAGRPMALRLYSPQVAQRSDVMAMIEQIYSATNAMPPDTVLPVMDAGYDQQTAAPFTVTEQSPAPSLLQLISQRPLGAQEVAAIARSLGNVLDQAHARGLMHHALKPANVFVQPGPFSVRVMDFGAGLARSYVQTNEGYATAAPWVAPEQMQGGVQAGVQADVFAMALVLFYALTGRSYWLSCQGAQPDLAAWQHELVGPRKPASQRAQELGATISPVLDAVFNRALSVDPNERFRQASELAAAFSAAATMPDMATNATIAFPSMGTGAGGPDPMGPTASVPAYAPPGQPSQEPGSGYPPPPPPAGGMGGPQMGGMGGPQMGGMGGPQMGGMGGMGGPQMGGMPGPDAGAGPGPMAPTGTAQRPNFDQGGGGNSKLIPILVGAGALVLVAGIGAFFLFGKKKTDDSDQPIAITPTAASASATASSETPPPTPPPTETAAPAAPESDVTIKCSPACDEIKIDDNKLEDPSKPTKLAAGPHKVTVSKAGYVTQNDDIEVKAGEAFKKEYKLAAEPKDAPPPPTTAKTAPTTTSKPGGSTKPGKTCTGVGLFKKCK